MPAWPHAWTSCTLYLPSPMLQVGDQEAELAGVGQAFSRHVLSTDLCFLPSGRQGLLVGREATIKARPGTLCLHPNWPVRKALLHPNCSAGWGSPWAG